MLPYLIYILTGAFAGTIAGLLGVAGGIIVVPALAFTFLYGGMAPSVEMHLAAGTSLAAIFITAIFSTLSHHRRQAVLWHLVWIMLPGLILGVVFGGVFAHFISSRVLSYLFASFLCVVALQMYFYIPHPDHKLPGNAILTSFALGVGVLSGLLGVGGGTIIAPFLYSHNVPIRIASGTSAACGIPIAIIGTITFILTGWHQPDLPPSSIGYVYWPAAIVIAVSSIAFVPLGAVLSKWLPGETIKNIFAAFLLLTALRMFFL